MPTSSNDDEVENQARREPVYLRRVAAAQYVQERYGLRCSKQTLAKLATMGGGPIFHSAGRTPLYSPVDLDEWALSKISGPRASTSTLADTATA
jgi:hypothetical protein